MDQGSDLQRIKDAVAGEGHDRAFSRKAVVLIASVLAASIAVAFLSYLAIKIGAAPLLVIVFGVLALMAYDLFDSMRAMMRPNGNGDAGSDG